MPLYEYECESCKMRLEVIQKFSDEPLSVCAHCGGRVHRLLSSSAFHFKGTGWYVTDYGRKSAPGSASADDAKQQKDADSGKESEKPAAAAAETTKESKAAENAPAKPSSVEKD
ncbi:MAG: FmdB family zinc ribbon protein [Terriglobia bacterium]